MSLTTDLALLLLRGAVGSLIAGHGTQKLFGAYGGLGVEGTTRTMRTLGLQPARPMALAAGASELGGGVLTAAGLFGPIGPLAGIGAMTVAATTAHADKPIWAQKGGAELPLTNMAVLGALLIAGHGHLALDRLLGIRVPRLLALPILGGIAALGATILADRASGAPQGRVAVPVDRASESGRVPWSAERATSPSTEHTFTPDLADLTEDTAQTALDPA